jgi:hypothetical protein
MEHSSIVSLSIMASPAVHRRFEQSEDSQLGIILTPHGDGIDTWLKSRRV